MARAKPEAVLTNFNQQVQENPVLAAIESGLLFGLQGRPREADVDERFERIRHSDGSITYIVKSIVAPERREPSDLERMISRQRTTAVRQVESCDMLPTEYLEKYGPDGQWAAFGFKIGLPVPNDELFTSVELPKGWGKRSNRHPLWVDLVDAAGNVRSSFFYDGSFHNRRATMSDPKSRYRTMPGKGRSIQPGSEYLETIVIDCTKATFSSDGTVCDEAIIYTYGENKRADECWTDTSDRVKKVAEAWLDAKFPKHNDPLSYWPKRAVKQTKPQS